MKISNLIATLVFFHAFACGKPQNQPMESRSNEVDVKTLMQEEGLVKVEVTVGEKSVTWTVNDETGLEKSEADSASFDPGEIEALTAAAAQYHADHIQSKEASLAEKSAFLLLDYLASAPAGHVIASRSYEKLSLADIGITCIKKGSSVKAEWNTRTQGYVSEWITTGSNWPNGYGCMGRCGADCGWGAPSSWTKDCMDHDACSYRNRASGGSSDPNCGDEFNEAQDDWTWGVSRGCSG